LGSHQASIILIELLSSNTYDHMHRFFDIGAARKFELARKMFYTGLSGIVMVFDVTNRNSYDHLRHWIHELRWTNAARPVESTTLVRGGCPLYSSTDRVYVIEIPCAAFFFQK
jgi:GTPase SAR1 family protein